METWDWVAIAASAASIAAAIYSGRQAKAARSQAESAKHQVELMKKQVAVAEEANRLNEKALAEEREARTLTLDVAAKPVKEGDRWWLVISIENNCQLPANIQEIAAVFADGSRLNVGRLSGEIQLPHRGSHIMPWLPGELSPGQSCEFRFCEYKQTESGSNVMVPPDYEQPRWRGLERVEVKASNRVFLVDEGDGHWRRQFVHGWSSLNAATGT